MGGHRHGAAGGRQGEVGRPRSSRRQTTAERGRASAAAGRRGRARARAVAARSGRAQASAVAARRGRVRPRPGTAGRGAAGTTTALRRAWRGWHVRLALGVDEDDAIGGRYGKETEAALGSHRGWGRAPPLQRDEPRGAAQAAWRTGAGHGRARRGGRDLQRRGQILALPTTASAGKCERRHGQMRARAGGSGHGLTVSSPCSALMMPGGRNGCHALVERGHAGRSDVNARGVNRAKEHRGLVVVVSYVLPVRAC
ncbi:uncharacterized protein LOC123424806 [Hordeum vulgare subsp. vulgare]|uniref:Predicted protein n=1 Tax=Hordeum vulgare subsp. vulgare TaxID=112509 RepID=F2DES6_HORVV|nr:uncharacterized protein LOC123424806 [Hordeum vulgare subsp. vulgare]BAJ93597.1 predicted protein [Hordeum vulgare subsp. vulgare]